MMPPDKNNADIKNETKVSILDSLEQHDEATTAVIRENNEDGEDDYEIVFYMDEEGQLYYDPSTGNRNIMSILMEVAQEEVVPETQSLVNEDHQTMIQVESVFYMDEEGQLYYDPSTGNRDIMSILMEVAQEEVIPETQSLVNGDHQTMIQVESEFSNETVILIKDKEKNNEMYTFKDLEAVASEVNKPPDLRSTKQREVHNFDCNFCSYKSHKRYLLQRHMNSHSEGLRYKCEICDKGFKFEVSLQNHHNMPYGIKPYACKSCDSSFTTSSELLRHTRYRHTHKKPHKCNDCDYAAVELSKLKRHIRCHTMERPYQCSDCTYAAQNMCNLNRHRLTHTGERPYKCDICSMCFTQSSSLKSHKLIHNLGVRPAFPCKLCPAKYSRKVSLRTHIQKHHTTHQLQICMRCDKTFPDRYSLKMHNKTHNAENYLKCNVCSNIFTKCYLKTHMLIHNNKKPFVCDQCDHAFRQKQQLRNHQNLYHNPNYELKPPKEKIYACNKCK